MEINIKFGAGDEAKALAALTFLMNQDSPAPVLTIAPSPAPVRAKPGPKPKAAPAPKPAPEPETEPETDDVSNKWLDDVIGDAPEEEFTQQDAIKIATELVASGDAAKVKSALTLANAARISELSGTGLATFMKAARA